MMNNSQVRVIDPILTDFVRGYSNNKMVGDLLFPRVEVLVSGGQVIQFGKESLELYDTLRAPGAATKRMELGYLGVPFALEQHALEGLVPYENMRDAAEVPHIDLARESLMSINEAMALKTEFAQASLATNASLYPAGNVLALTGATNFSASSSSPKTTVTAARAAIRAATGKYPNVMILPPNGIYKLDMHPEIRDRLKYTNAGNATADILARYFEMDTVAEGNAVYAANANAPMSDVWGNNIVLAYVPSDFRAIRAPSYGYTYSMRGQPSVKMPYQDSNRDSWVYGVRFERIPVMPSAVSGFLIQNVF